MRLTTIALFTAASIAAAPVSAKLTAQDKRTIRSIVKQELAAHPESRGGPAGPAGPMGPPGPPGLPGATTIIQPGQEAKSVRFAHVNEDGTVVQETSSGIGPSNVFLEESGTQAMYCLVGLGEIKGAQITLDNGFGSDPEGEPRREVATRQGFGRLGFFAGFPGCENYIVLSGEDGQTFRHGFFLWLY